MVDRVEYEFPRREEADEPSVVPRRGRGLVECQSSDAHGAATTRWTPQDMWRMGGRRDHDRRAAAGSRRSGDSDITGEQ